MLHWHHAHRKSLRLSRCDRRSQERCLPRRVMQWRWESFRSQYMKPTIYGIFASFGSLASRAAAADSRGLRHAERGPPLRKRGNRWRRTAGRQQRRELMVRLLATRMISTWAAAPVPCRACRQERKADRRSGGCKSAAGARGPLSYCRTAGSLKRGNDHGPLAGRVRATDVSRAGHAPRAPSERRYPAACAGSGTVVVAERKRSSRRSHGPEQGGNRAPTVASG